MSSKKNDKLRVAWMITSAAAIVILIVYFVKLNGVYREEKEKGLLDKTTGMQDDSIVFETDESNVNLADLGLNGDSAGKKDDGAVGQKTESKADDTAGTVSPEDGGAVPVKDDGQQGKADEPDVNRQPDGAEQQENPGQQDNPTGEKPGENDSSTSDGGKPGENDSSTSDGGKPGENDSSTSDGGKPDGAVSYVNEYGLDPSKPMVALTFDDGPGIYTEQILALLAKYNAHATFFMVGYNIDEYPEVVKAVYESGNEIGNHSINHPNLKTLSEAEIKKELNGNQDKINAACGATLNCIVRPPYGNYNDKVKANCPHPMILWSVDTLDWSSRNAQEVLKEVKKQTNDGCVILCHDIYKSTMEAVELYLPWLVEQGYQVCTVSQMYKSRGEFQKDGHVYSHTMTAEEFLAAQNQETAQN